MGRKFLFTLVYIELCALVFTLTYYVYPQQNKPQTQPNTEDVLFDDLSQEDINAGTEQDTINEVLGLKEEAIVPQSNHVTPLDLSSVVFTKDVFLNSLQFNKTKNIILIKPAFSKGNYFLSFDDTNGYKTPDDIILENLNKISSLIKWNEGNPGVGDDIGISFVKGEVLDIEQFHSNIRDRKVDSMNLTEDITIDINRVMFDLSRNKVLLGMTNSFNENAWSAGDAYVMLDPETAIVKLQNAKKASTLFVDINYPYQLYKHKNIDVAINNSKGLFPEIQNEIDMVKFIGLDHDKSQNPEDFVMGEAIIGEKHVKVIGGGVCAAASFLNASIELGLRAYGINYQRELRNSHTDTRYRYRLASTYPDLQKNPDRFDVTVYYDKDKPKNIMTSKIKIEDGKKVKMDIHKLILQTVKDPGRSMYLFEVSPV